MYDSDLMVSGLFYNSIWPLIPESSITAPKLGVCILRDRSQLWDSISAHTPNLKASPAIFAIIKASQRNNFFGE